MYRNTISFTSLAFLLGTAVRALALHWHEHRADKQSPPISPTVLLYRYKLKPDKLAVFDQWVQFERENHGETLQTLVGEHMYVEAVLRDREHDPRTLYWIAVDGPKKEHMPLPAYAIDQKYREFEAQVLEKDSRQLITPDYVLIPEFLTKAIQQHESNN